MKKRYLLLLAVFSTICLIAQDNNCTVIYIDDFTYTGSYSDCLADSSYYIELDPANLPPEDLPVELLSTDYQEIDGIFRFENLGLHQSILIKYQRADGCIAKFVSTVESFSVESSFSNSCADTETEAWIELNLPWDGITILWENGATDSSAMVPIGWSNYTISQPEIDGCSYSDSLYVDSFPYIWSTGEVEVTDFTNCEGLGSITFLDSSLYHFEWEDGYTGAARDGLLPGEYTIGLTAKNDSSCIGSNKITIGSSTLEDIEVTTIGSPKCYSHNGQAALSTNRDDLLFVWPDGDTTDYRNDLLPLNHAVQIYEESGCYLGNVHVDVGIEYGNDDPYPSVYSHTGMSQCGDSVGFVHLVSPYEHYIYEWADGFIGSYRDTLPLGFSQYWAVDTLGRCSQPMVAYLWENDIITNYEVVPTPCSNPTVILYTEVDQIDFIWEDGYIGSTRTNVEPGTYQVSAVHSSEVGCEQNINVTVAKPEYAVEINLSGNCGWESIFISSPYPEEVIFNWSNGFTGDTLFHPTTAVQEVEAYYPELGCSDFVEVNLAELFQADIWQNLTIDIIPAFCNFLGEIQIYFPAEELEELNLIWEDGYIGNFRTQLNPGQYQIQIVNQYDDILECFWVDIPLVNYIEVDTNIGHSQSCQGAGDGTISINTDYENLTYSWEDGHTGASREGLLPGTYSVTISNETGECSQIEEFVILPLGIDQLTNLDEYITPPYCGNSGSVSLPIISSTLGQFSYTWADGYTGNQRDSLGAGSYPISIHQTTTQGCSFSYNATLEVEDNTIPGLNTSITPNSSCTSLGNGQITISTDVEILDFQWSDGTTGRIRQNLLAGIYEFTVTEPSGQCTYTEQVVVPESSDYFNSLNFYTDCENNTLFAHIGDGAGALDNSTFVWSNGTQNIYTNLGQLEFTPGETYSLQISSPSGCERTLHNIDPEDYCFSREVINIQTTIGSASVSSEQEEICIPINSTIVQGIQNQNIATFVGTINYDPDLISYIGYNNSLIEDIEIPGIQVNEPIPGELRFLFFSFDTSAVYNLDNTLLFELCFVAIADEGICPINATNNPLNWAFYNYEEDLFIPSVQSGYIDLGTSRVWPGDANRNGRVTHYDILNLGLANATSGPIRPDASLEWTEQLVDSWTDIVPTTDINAAHTDCDGSGLVDTFDLSGIEENWSLTTPWYNPDFDTEIFNPAQSSAAYPLFVESDTLTPDGLAAFDIYLGTDDLPAEDIYGLAFSVAFDNYVIDTTAEIIVEINPSWLGDPGDDLISAHRIFPTDGRIDIGITRIDGEARSGYGPIATFYITIEDVIFRGSEYPFDFRIFGQKMNNSEGQLVISNAQLTTSYLVQTTNTDHISNQSETRLFPNPNQGRLNLVTPHFEGMTVYEILDFRGKLCKTGRFYGTQTEINIQHLPQGSYIMRLVNDQEIITKKFILSP